MKIWQLNNVLENEIKNLTRLSKKKANLCLTMLNLFV